MIVLVFVFLGAGFYWVHTLNVAHRSFENYYNFRGCSQLLEKTDTYGVCKTSSGKIITLVRVQNKWYLDGDSPTEGSSRRLINTFSYSCNGGKTISAAYYQGEDKPALGPDKPPVPGGSVTLAFEGGRSLTLHQTLSADGVRYANPDESFIFWSKGNGALVLENNEQKSYIGCIVVAPELANQNLPKVYSNSAAAFSLRYPAGYIVNESYRYQALGPGKDIWGVKFTIPASVSSGTNLSSDSYISVEEIPQTQECSPAPFTFQKREIKTITEDGTTYSVMASSDAAAGNRYEETIYAILGTNPCVAVLYFIHYGVFENYPPGVVKQFDKQAILEQFDQIRRTLVVNQ